MKPAERELVVGDLEAAAEILASVAVIARDATQAGENDAAYLLIAIQTLAEDAHDRIDVALRALGDVGIGFRGAVARRLDKREVRDAIS